MPAQSADPAVFMLWAILLFFCGGMGGIITSNRTGNGSTGFWLGLLLGPLGVLISFFVGSEKAKQGNLLATGQRKKCPMCAELVQPEALICKHCGHKFQETAA